MAKRTSTPKNKQKATNKQSNPLDPIKKYSKAQLELMLNERQKKFCHLYILRYNGTQSYIEAYGRKKHVKRSTAEVNSHKLLRQTKIKQYIEHLKGNLEETLGISKADFINDLTDIAKAKLPDMYKTWLSKKELDVIKNQHPELDKAIQQIDTKMVHKTDPITKEPFQEEYCKIKLKDSLRATDMIFKALGWNAAEKIDVKQETKVNIDITKYDENEKALLLKMARKNQFNGE